MAPQAHGSQPRPFEVPVDRDTEDDGERWKPSQEEIVTLTDSEDEPGPTLLLNSCEPGRCYTWLRSVWRTGPSQIRLWA